MASPLLEQRAHDADASTCRDRADGRRRSRRAWRRWSSNLLTNAAQVHAGRAGASTSRRRATATEVVLRGARQRHRHRRRDAAARLRPVRAGAAALDRAQGGLGLGLTIVQQPGRAARRHASTAHSDGPGRGSEFVVRLPARRDGRRAPTRRASRGTAAARAARRARVLVVDDNEDAAELLAEALRLLGHDVHVAHDGADGAAPRPRASRLRRGAPRHRPAGDGRLRAGGAAARAARRQRPAAGRPDRLRPGIGPRRTSAAGFDAHLVKPVDLDA